MKILVFLEPIYFRNKADFVSAHYAPLVEPILAALIGDNTTADVAIMSNILVCLRGVEVIRKLENQNINLHFYPISGHSCLEPVGFSKRRYCRDVFETEQSPSFNSYLATSLEHCLHDFAPHMVITTSHNSYLAESCLRTNTCLLTTEFGPFPRLGFPNNRSISFHRHYSRLSPRTSECSDFESDYDRSVLSNVLNRQLLATEKHPLAQKIKNYCEVLNSKHRLALLALQPPDWITWEGSLAEPYSPTEIVMLALKKMSADLLIVNFHPDQGGRVSPSIIAELWLSGLPILRVPPEFNTATAELFVPHVHEVITVSSNVGFLAYLNGKKLTLLGDSYLNNLPHLSTEPDDQGPHPGFVRSFFENSHIPEDIYTKPHRLRSAIIHKLKKEAMEHLLPAIRSQGGPEEAKMPSRAVSDNLKQTHRAIKRQLDHYSFQVMLQRFGRLFLGYLVNEGAIGAELGVAGGYFSESLLLSGRFRTLYSIDSWSDHHNDAEFKSVKKRLRWYGRRSMVLRSTFEEALHKIPDGTLNFLYVDGYAHTGMNATVLADWLPKLANNAVVAGHDYCRRMWPANVAGIDQVAAAHEFQRITAVPGIITTNDEDAIPSFYMYYKKAGRGRTPGCFQENSATALSDDCKSRKAVGFRSR